MKQTIQCISRRSRTLLGAVALFCIAGMALTTSSCVSYKEIPYFQNLPDSGYVYREGEKVPVTPYEELTIRQDDILSITIQTMDPDMGNLIGGSVASTLERQLPTATSQLGRGLSENISGYLVGEDGMVELPVAGKVKVGGLTTVQAREVIKQKAMNWYRDPVVNVRLVNFRVSVMGEVQRPGSYIINGEKANILDALSLAGDMTIFGVRTNVVLARIENGKQKLIRFNLNNTDIYQSPYFYLRQGDMVYVQPSKGKAASTDGNSIRIYAIITSTLSLLVVAAARL